MCLGTLEAFSQANISSGSTSVTSTCIRSKIGQPNIVNYSSIPVSKCGINKISSVTPNSVSRSENHVVSTSLYEFQSSISNPIPSIMSFLPGNIIHPMPTNLSRSESGNLIISTAGYSDKINAATTVSSVIGSSVVPCSQIGESALSPLLGMHANSKNNTHSGIENTVVINTHNQRLITPTPESDGKHLNTGEPSLTAVVSSGKASGYAGKYF